MNRLALLLSAIMAAALPLQAASLGSKEPAAMTVEFISGTATYTNKTTGGILVKGQALAQGDEITSADDGWVDLHTFFHDIRLSPGSRVILERLKFEATSHAPAVPLYLFVDRGSVLCSVKQLNGASPFAVKSSRGHASIMGTRFLFTADGLCQCVEGMIDLSYFGSKEAYNGWSILGNQTTYLQSHKLRAGQTITAPASPAAMSKPEPLPAERARSLERDFDDLKKHRVRKAR